MAISRTALFLALAFGAGAAALAQPADPPASHPFAASQPIAGRYIVVFKDSVANPAAEAANLARGLGGQLHHAYTSAIKGFAASLPDAALQALRNNPNVDYVEQDRTVSLNLEPTPVTQSDAAWGLDRIDQQRLADDPVSSPYNYLYKYTANGVDAFIIDTGIRASHIDFEGRVRVSDGYTAISDGRGTDDCNGHGTHVAGTVGGARWGVAKSVSLIPVRVLNCQGSGTWSGVIAGIDFTANKVMAGTRPAVANMSLGGGASSAVDQAVAGAVSKGVTMVVAAGNSNADACNYSPARAPSAITVGATTSSDARASYSNYGKCLDLFAPGSGITSAWNTSNTATNTISGTSMASPHVTGVAALALAANTAASPWAVAAFLTANGTSGQVDAAGAGSPNLFVYSLANGSPQQPPGQTVAVRGMAGNATSYKNGWRASVDVLVSTLNSSNAWVAMPGATAVVSFSPGGTGSCTTTASGTCTLSSGLINKSTVLTKASVTGVSGNLMNYDPAQNQPAEISIHK